MTAGLDPERAAIVREVILQRHAAVAGLAADAERSLGAGRREEAARAAAQAALAAWLEHAGIHASPTLERVVARLLPRERSWRPVVRRPSPEVLHVLTQAYPTGGHTRWSDRIIRSDTARRHSVVLTGQGDQPVPSWLDADVRASGGRIHRVGPGPLLGRAAAVRRLAAGADLVVANLHPNDVAGVAALSDPASRPPVALLNHADHAFWLGTAMADLVVGFRRSGNALALDRRGVPQDRLALLPLPLDAPRVVDDRAAVRAGLGLGPEDVLLLTTGSTWKYDPVNRLGLPGLPDLVAPIVAADPRLRLVALGPPPVGAWPDAGRMTGGRIMALGRRPDYPDYVAAADLYLDAFPVGSLYSLLEPALAGVAALSFARLPEDAAVLMSDDPGLDGILPRPTGEAEYLTTLAGLADDPGRRSALGAALAESVAAVHTGPAWQAAFDAVVDRAVAAHEARLGGGAPVEDDPSLAVPSTAMPSLALAWLPEAPPALPAQVRLALPLAAT